ncbi:ABC-2 type transport system ATP-binding protein [Micromonospora pattaloongensis]|uniref:ABC-2 type transport system ATP-binding protein n=1 Tax=Micromonospora pattaloongensis TaxID=405436 RepID=A0A1H3GG94_9ACTN|nr:ABC transporter ATP-binding protein [Micromonospora pattaloongensis]SDY01329.1 ABC-2 type transport system ATP-binding protein [Micromonospora pattaloongensis]
MGPAVEVHELVKRYPKRDVNAVDGLSFAVETGEVFGLLGPNGAGKTTTVGILTTMVRATSGGAYVGGVDVLRDPVRARARFAVVPQRSNLDRSLTPRQNLTFHAAYHGYSRAERNARAATLLDEFGLIGQADTKVDFYSGGMAQRLMIARSLMHEPQVLFLDEPTTGLDPQARLFVWERLRELRGRGVTIMLTTHDMDEAAQLADRVGIVDHGRLLALDTPPALVRRLTGQTVLDLTVVAGAGDDTEKLLAALTELPGVERGEQVSAAAGGAGPADGATLLRLYVTGEPAALLAPVAGVLAGRSASLTDVHFGEPSLEDVFIDLTGRALR